MARLIDADALKTKANYCDRIVIIKPQPYDFCSYGERKEDK